MHRRHNLYVSIVAAAGLIPTVVAALTASATDPGIFLSYAVLTLLAVNLRIRRPGTPFEINCNFVFVPLGLASVGFSATLPVVCSSVVLANLVVHSPRRNIDRLLFEVGSMAVAIGVSEIAFLLVSEVADPALTAGAAFCAGVVFFAAETLPIAGWTCLTEKKNSLMKVWRERHFWSFRYYLTGAAGVGVLSALAYKIGWQSTLLLLPLVHFAHRSYKLYPARLEAEKRHAGEMAALHLRTIEALALAIEAKDDTTHDHLRRVQVYAVEIGKELGLSGTELKALQAAALLHDIGKLAIPEHIVSKPGKLTPDEFDKMKIHPIVGAEILERVQFPYPAAPIVRSHHERWDGTGYPDGLQREEIPIGARILSAVDCLDALASDRPYRRALPLDEAIEAVAAEAGRSYDPEVVEILTRRYLELERLAQAQPDKSRLFADLKIERGKSPAAGFEAGADVTATGTFDFLASIASARQEAQTIFELTRDLGTSLSLDETLSVLTVRLKRLVPYDSVVFYTCRDDIMTPVYVNGENTRLFCSLEVPLGEGLAGWVAANGKPILNGDPEVEPGYVNDPNHTPLQSALALPLEGLYGFVGVLMLYRTEQDAFTRDHLRILKAVAYKVSLSIENALKYRQAESGATTDYLTGLPNARSLFLHLDAELARAKRSGNPLTVLVCDLDGFKQVNDQFGHLEGNEVLRAIARALQEACREYDYVARMGGDEFVVVLPGLSDKAAEEKVASLRKVINECCGKDFLSMSVGEAFYPADGDNVEQLLAVADRRMYTAKSEHRDPLSSLAAATQNPRERTADFLSPAAR